MMSNKCLVYEIFAKLLFELSAVEAIASDRYGVIDLEYLHKRLDR
jgi:hypothetical protein